MENGDLLHEVWEVPHQAFHQRLCNQFEAWIRRCTSGFRGVLEASNYGTNIVMSQHTCLWHQYCHVTAHVPSVTATPKSGHPDTGRIGSGEMLITSPLLFDYPSELLNVSHGYGSNLWYPSLHQKIQLVNGCSPQNSIEHHRQLTASPNPLLNVDTCPYHSDVLIYSDDCLLL